MRGVFIQDEIVKIAKESQSIQFCAFISYVLSSELFIEMFLTLNYSHAKKVQIKFISAELYLNFS